MQPIWLLTLLALPLLWWRNRHRAPAGMRVPDAPASSRSWRTRLRASLNVWWLLALALLMLAMARPQWRWNEEKVEADAVDIVLALDISMSMLSRDFDPDRLTVAERVLSEFINNRPYDRLGLVPFAAEAFTLCPLTTDRNMLQRSLADIEVGRLDNGTAIGLGLATALNRLKNSEAKSKIVILVTDGDNNAGYITPLQAADIAVEMGARVYTVGIGTEGMVLMPAMSLGNGRFEYMPRLSHFNTDLLEKIAQKTKGKFYRAFSPEEMAGIYAEIDRLEKTRITIRTEQHSAELGPWLALAGAILLLIAEVLRWGWLRTVVEG